ncbi:MAG: hypothetical protein A3G93_07145 [Nitrospinae bacterium RIFCSPLOWO2_12_FULL_45_22]|nr:MAG: hypothetical protein A3G93_07145 [Nitrospinae bacterium RIFCSPLOWO2_12_FULL_45_22]
MISGKEALRKLLNIYAKCPLFSKLHIWVRFKSCPFLELIKYIPEDGKILDLGCGYGLFTCLLHLTSPGRNIIGIDLDRKKLGIAIKVTTNCSEKISFRMGDICEIGENDLDCITIIDVLYLIPFERWELIFENCFNRLKPNGLLLIKEMGKKPSWKYIWNLIQETLSVKIFNITEGNSFYFKTPLELGEDLRRIGFKVTRLDLNKRYAHPHFLYLCRKG